MILSQTNSMTYSLAGFRFVSASLSLRNSGFRTNISRAACLRRTKYSNTNGGISMIPPRRNVLFRNRSYSRDAEVETVDQELRRSVEIAIQKLGYRVTVGDVAASAGVSVASATEALNALASDTGGVLEVSSSGELVYGFPPDFKARLRGVSLRVRLEPLLEKAQASFAYLVRVIFGTTLIVSAVAVWVAILAILSSTRSSNDDRRGNNDVGSYFMTRSILNLSDLFWYWDPYYYQRRDSKSDRKLSFVESIFSFVFGDPDPNANFEVDRWAQLGALISQKGGVVTAEEMAPYMVSDSGSGDLEQDESFVLPALVRFGGEAEVTDEGEIIYVFPTFQVTATGKRWFNSQQPMVIMEKQQEFTNASGGQVLGALVLGLLNFAGVFFLTTLLHSPRAAVIGLEPSALSFIGAALPFLQVYAVSFFLIPLFRWMIWRARNNDIVSRNMARESLVDKLKSKDAKLQGKLAKARSLSREQVLERRNSIFRSDKEISEQAYDGL